MPRPFLDVNENGRLAHSSPRGGVLYEDKTYNDRRVLIAASKTSIPMRPALIVLFHGNQGTLARDVVERQQAPRQVAQSSLNAVLLAPQLAVDANNSSAGNFWRPGGFAEFLNEADAKLAELYPQASRARHSDSMPVVIVAYSGGYLPAAYSLEHGGADDRVRGVVLLDALFGEGDKFARWIERDSGRAFFVSAYSASSSRQNLALASRLRHDGVSTVSGLPDSLHSGVVAFVDATAASHDDFLTAAWTRDPLTMY